jgi:hypothetical protein
MRRGTSLDAGDALRSVLSRAHGVLRDYVLASGPPDEADIALLADIEAALKTGAGGSK